MYIIIIINEVHNIVGTATEQTVRSRVVLF